MPLPHSGDCDSDHDTKLQEEIGEEVRKYVLCENGFPLHFELAAHIQNQIERLAGPYQDLGSLRIDKVS